MKTRKDILARLAAFKPTHLEVIDESAQHNVPKDGESHFKVILVSDVFLGRRLLERHRQVNECLSDLLAEKIHALALHTFTNEEWQHKSATPSPPCLGGSKE